MANIGITTTVPVEVIFASGNIAMDLNNVFITDPDPAGLVQSAEDRGLPRNLCSWVKGIYGVLERLPYVRTIISVVEGDCSNTLALSEILEHEGRKVIPFAYPFERDERLLRAQIEKLTGCLGATWEDAESWKKHLDRVRGKALEIDLLTWRENLVTGEENHLYLVSCSDFEQDADAYERKLDDFLANVKSRNPLREKIRLGYAGVPPIFSDLYRFLEERGARAVFNEMQRQFAMPYRSDTLLEQYLLYTYPYSVFGRIKDIQEQIEIRNVHGLIHYTQAFCHHQIEDVILRESLSIPVLCLEGDRPGRIDARTRMRLESFLEMLEGGLAS